MSRQGIDIDKLKHQHLSGKVRREIATKIVQSSTVTVVLMSWHELFLSGNQGNHQNLIPSMLTYKFWPIFHMDEGEKKNQNGRFAKTEFFNSANSQFS